MHFLYLPSASCRLSADDVLQGKGVPLVFILPVKVNKFRATGCHNYSLLIYFFRLLRRFSVFLHQIAYFVDMKFSEVIGQDDAKERLRQMVAENRVPHAIMLCGPQGCGKMALALAFCFISVVREQFGRRLLRILPTVRHDRQAGSSRPSFLIPCHTPIGHWL